MSTIPRAKQQAVMADLQERYNIQRQIKARSRLVLSAELNIGKHGLASAINHGTSRFLSADQVAYAQRAERERIELESRLPEFTFPAIAQRNQVGWHTVLRYHHRLFIERTGLPICDEEFRRAV